jgi:hypothetical protein
MIGSMIETLIRHWTSEECGGRDGILPHPSPAAGFGLSASRHQGRKRTTWGS